MNMTVQSMSRGLILIVSIVVLTLGVSVANAKNIKKHNLVELDHETNYTFRQFGLKAPKPTGDGRINLMVTPAGWPTYVDGEQVMLFLHKPAAKSGFQTTAGLTQGKFTIRGNEIANGIGNDELFARMTVSGPLTPNQDDLVNQPGGAYAAEAFIELVRTAVEENWIDTGVMTNAQK